MIENEKDEVKKNTGLPDIAISGRNKKILIVIMAIIVIAVLLNQFYFSKSSQVKMTQQQAEEIYTVQSDHIGVNKIEPVAVTSATPEATPINSEMMQQQLAILQMKQKELQQRLAAPLMVVSQANSATDSTQQVKRTSSDANTQFMNQVSAQASEVATATSIGSLNSIVAEGNLIHAILESASNSDLPGMLRASVSEVVYSEDGSKILIPQGSRLIGQYKSGVAQGQSRIFIVWTRLITPNGFSIQLGSPGVDNLGVAGMGADEINRHFWERFGSASLLSLIGAGVANVGMNGEDQGNAASSYKEAVATSFSQSASQSLQQDSRIAPTLKTYQGKPIMVFVAKDLHFSNAMKSVNHNMNVF